MSTDTRTAKEELADLIILKMFRGYSTPNEIIRMAQLQNELNAL